MDRTTSFVAGLAALVLTGTVAAGAEAGADATEPATLPASASPSSAASLQAQIQKMQAELDALKAREAARENAATAAATASAVESDAAKRGAGPLMDVSGLTAGYIPNKGFVVGSEDGNFLLHPWVYFQPRYTAN